MSGLMGSYVFKRLAFAIPLLLAVALGAFVLVRLAPGGPFDRERAPSSPGKERALQARYHLDEPVWRQFGRFVGGLLQGDLGPSLKYRSHSVNDILAQAFPVSATLGLLSFVVALGLGIPIGVWGSVERGNGLGAAADLWMLLAISVPALVVGPVWVLVFALKLGWFPTGLWTSPWHMVLPTLTLGGYFSGRVARLMREGMDGVREAPFLLAAKARGIGPAARVWRHGFRIAVLPVVSYSGPMLADLLTGSFVVENVFQVPGLGVFLVNSSLNRDYTMVVGLVLVYAVLLILLNLVVDVVYGLIDPRIRHG